MRRRFGLAVAQPPERAIEGVFRDRLERASQPGECQIPMASDPMQLPQNLERLTGHRIPLSRQALEILRELHRVTGHRNLAFPGLGSTLKPISENTLNGALRRLGYGQTEASAHGFRASASTLLNETGKWSSDAIERQLGHIDNNGVRRA